MPDEDRSTRIERSLDEIQKNVEGFQKSVQDSGPAASVSYGLIGAILLLGGIGYAVDYWLGGLVLGLVVGFYELARTVFKR